MKRHLVLFIVTAVLLAVLPVCLSRTNVEADIYKTISTREVFSELITRDKDDRTYSGQIKSGAGLEEFTKIYGVNLKNLKVDFKKQVLIFGITDEISTRAFQFLKQEQIRSFTLDYMDTGIKYKLRKPEDNKKHSYIQVFVIKNTEGISHISVKNLIRNGLSRVYDKSK